jgi:hypothetical protein
MEGPMTSTAIERPEVPEVKRRLVRQHLFLSVVAVCILLGGGLRLLATGSAAAAGSGPQSTACAAK